jgi:hypothetical protein
MPRFNFPSNQVPPDPPDVAELAIFPVGVVPYALGALESRATAHTWAEDSYLRGNQLIRSLQMALLTGGMQELLEGQNRLYRLVDSAMYGRAYTVETEEPLVIAPEIPAVPDQTLEPAGLLTMVDALPGILDAGWFGIGGHKATLADVVKALRIGTPEKATEAIDTFQEMLSAAGNIATVGDLVTDLFSASVDAVEEGGILLLLAGGIVGTMAGLQGLSMQLTTLAALDRRIIQSLDGGAITGPDDNVLMALRGISEASETRNVIDAIVAALEAISTSDPDVLAKLEEIRELLA